VILSKEDMTRHLASMLRSIQVQPELIKSFIRMPDAKHILEATAWTADTFATINPYTNTYSC
jgi:hypothetical protein